MQIEGLTYIPNYISKDEQDELWNIIYQQSWLKDLKRRTQHYGYKYDYKARKIDLSMYLGHLPEWVNGLAVRLHQEKLVPNLPDQAIVNEYEPGQGITKHSDCKACFTDGIASLSLASGCMMDFRRAKEIEHSLYLELGSLVILNEEARYKWKHSIATRETDVVNGKKVERGVRVSITFRKVILSYDKEGK